MPKYVITIRFINCWVVGGFARSQNFKKNSFIVGDIEDYRAYTRAQL